MSKITRIHTDVDVTARELCKRLMDSEKFSLVIKDTSPTAKMHIPHVSIRETEFTKEDFGYEIQLTVLGCREDFELYRDTVHQVMLMTKGKAVYEEETEFTDALQFFNENFIQENMESEFVLTVSTVSQLDLEITLYCPIRKFYFGPNVYNRIAAVGEDKELQRQELYRLIRKMQYFGERHPLNDTPLYDVYPNNDEQEKKSLTVYERNVPEFISGADYFALLADEDEEGESVIVEYHNLHKIVPKNWTLVDEKQYSPLMLSDKQWKEFRERAEEYRVEL